VADYDVVIIGAGPSGLSCAIEANRRGLKTLLVDKGSVANSVRRFPVNMTFFSTPELLEVGGVPFPCAEMRPNRQDAVCYYQRAAKYAEVPLRLHSTVTGIKRDGNGFKTELDDGSSLSSDKVIIATGYFDNPRKLGIEGEELPHVSHYYDEPYRYAGTRVAVIGAGNSAVEAALDLYRNGAEVCMIHRGSDFSRTVKYWIIPDIKNRLENREIAKCFSCVVEEIKEASITIKNVDTQKTESLAVDFVFVLVGYTPDTQLISSVGVKVDPTTLVPTHDPNTFETNVPGLFVAGSVTSGESIRTIFIENGRMHAKPIVDRILEIG
jgi:thioredoxin reductase (NADPH)